MTEETCIFSKTRPRMKGLTVVCVPYVFRIAVTDGKKIAVPVFSGTRNADETKSGYLRFASEKEAAEFLRELKVRFERNGITNFGDIARSAGLSRDMLKLARGVRKSGGLFSLKSFLLGPSGSVRSVVKDAESLENSDWYQVFLKHRSGTLRPEGRSAGDSPMSAKFNIPCKLYQKKAEDEEISFQIPGSVINMKGTQSLYEDMRKMFGKDNVMLKSDFKAQKTFTKEPKARTITRETKDGGDK